MGYLTVDDRGRIDSGMGSIFSSIFGRGDRVKKGEASGQSLQQIYAGYKPDFARYLNETSRIPTGSGKTALQAKAVKIQALQRDLDQAFAPGATPGTEDRAKLDQYIALVKDYGKDKEALLKQYGLRPDAAGAKGAKGAAGPAKAGIGGGIPLWGWALGLLALAKFAKK